jgi:hypothetical protein
MTVLIYVETSKQVGDPEHLKVSQTRTPRNLGSRKTIRKALRSNKRFWSECGTAILTGVSSSTLSERNRLAP